MKNKKFYDIALSVGGSHYPSVGGELLERFAKEVIQECRIALDPMDSQDQAYELIKKHFDLDD